jgi:ribosomal protein L29
MNHRKSKLRKLCEGKSIKTLQDMLFEKRKELIKHEYVVRGNGGSNDRMAYVKGSRVKIGEIRKDIAFIETYLRENGKA